jgi:hypothetical protein
MDLYYDTTYDVLVAEWYADGTGQAGIQTSQSTLTIPESRTKMC